MQTFSKNHDEITPWRAIGEFLNGIRAGNVPDGVILDDIGTTDPRIPPHGPAPLFNVREKHIGDPVQLFPHTVKFDSAEAAADPAVRRWLDMLERLRPFNVKGQIAGVHRYLSAVENFPAIARVVRTLSWTGPVIRGHRDDDSADAALARYVSLRHLGIHTERLRLVWLADAASGSDWVVTAVLLDGRWLVLDHYHGDIADDDAYVEAAPYFSLNAVKCCLHWRQVDRGGDRNGAEAALQRLAGQLGFSRA